MREPAFWWQAGSWPARVLRPLAAVYGDVAARRMARAGTGVGVPVICIGNYTLGGTGKTPTAIAVARALIEAGERPMFLSRGYGGREGGPVLVDSARHGADAVGDEPLLLARAAPTVIARDRVAGAALARDRGASVVIMDDGLQNPSLAKDVTLAVIDGRRGFGNGRVFPAGPLRAPLPPQVSRTDGVVIIGDVAPAVATQLDANMMTHLPRWGGRFVPEAQAVEKLAGHRLAAFAGIGDPPRFFATLQSAGLDVATTRAFPDHHLFTRTELERMLDQAEAGGLVPVTTAKDHVRIATTPAITALAAAIRVFDVTLAIEPQATLAAFLMDRIVRARHR